MVNYREILRLKNLKYSQWEIASSVHSSRNTVKEVVDLASALKIEYPLDTDVTNQHLKSILYPERKEQGTEPMERLQDSPLSVAILDRIKHDAYKINIIPTDPTNYRFMREVYGLNPALSK